MSKDLKYGLYLDFYAGLITKIQLDALRMYYNEDYSLGEIAQEMGISRQGALDAIKRGEKKLDELEQKLCFSDRYTKLAEALDNIESLCGEIDNNELRLRLCDNIAKARTVWES